LKKKIKESRHLYINSLSEDNRLNYKIHKKNFRRIQRRNIFIYERNKSKNIEHLFETNNKEDFWKAFYSFKNKCKNDPYSDSQSSRLFDHFTKLFNSDNENINDDIHKQMVDERVKSYINECVSNFHEKGVCK
jgi:hypothetical protein